MPDTEPDTALLDRLVHGDPAAPDQVLLRSRRSASPSMLVAAALLTGRPALLAAASRHALTTRDRQLVALADARLRGDSDRLDVLVREHLSEHADSPLATWLTDPDLPRD
jgi:hypothetical protein